MIRLKFQIDSSIQSKQIIYYFFQLIIRNENKILKINRIYRVALLTLRQIKNNKVNFISNLQGRKIIKLKNKDEFAIRDLIEKYYLNKKSSFTIKDVFIIYYYYLMNPKNITLAYRIDIKIMRSS